MGRSRSAGHLATATTCRACRGSAPSGWARGYWLNDDEYKQRVAHARHAARQRQRYDSISSSAEAVRERFGTVGGAVSPPPHWLERSHTSAASRRYIIDPPNGRSRALTPEALPAQQERNAITAGAPARAQRREAELVHRSQQLRSLHQPRHRGSLTPKIYNSGNRIVQGPGWLAFATR